MTTILWVVERAGKYVTAETAGGNVISSDSLQEAEVYTDREKSAYIPLPSGYKWRKVHLELVKEA